MTNVLTFTTEAYAQAAKDKIWTNFVRQKALEGDNLVGLENDPKTAEQVAAMSDENVKDLMVYGFRGNTQKSLTNGFTLFWDDYLKAYNQDLWFMAEPPSELMSGVENYSAQTLNPDWYDPNLNP